MELKPFICASEVLLIAITFLGLYNKAKRTGSVHHCKKFFGARKRVHKNLKSAREEYISGHLSEAMKANPKRFWSYVTRLKQENPGKEDFEVDGKVISDGGLKLEIRVSQKLAKLGGEGP